MFKNLFRGKPWDEKQIAKWEKIRAKGKWRFVLLFATFCAVWMIFIFSAKDYFFSEHGLQPIAFWYVYIPMWSAYGVFVALVWWAGCEKKYRESLNQNEHPEKENP